MSFKKAYKNLLMFSNPVIENFQSLQITAFKNLSNSKIFPKGGALLLSKRLKTTFLTKYIY